jgi:hypothetical protein
MPSFTGMVVMMVVVPLLAVGLAVTYPAARRPIICLLAVLLLETALVTSHGALGGESGSTSSSASHHPELDYLKAVNNVAPPRDPELLFLLMAAYSNANLQGEGAEFFSAKLKEFDSRLSPVQKALYLSAIGLLRAQNASSISLLHRIGYVKETISTLQTAKQLSGGQVFVVNWIAGIVYAELPRQFDQGKAAEAELGWCLENIDKAPHAGWLREVYYHLGKLAVAAGEETKAQDYFAGAATGILIGQSRSSLLSPRRKHPGTRLPRGASARSCRVAYMSCPVSSSRNTISWYRTIGRS